VVLLNVLVLLRLLYVYLWMVELFVLMLQLLLLVLYRVLLLFDLVLELHVQVLELLKLQLLLLELEVLLLKSGVLIAPTTLILRPRQTLCRREGRGKRMLVVGRIWVKREGEGVRDIFIMASLNSRLLTLVWLLPLVVCLVRRATRTHYIAVIPASHERQPSQTGGFLLVPRYSFAFKV